MHTRTSSLGIALAMLLPLAASAHESPQEGRHHHGFDFSLRLEPGIAVPLDDTLRANYAMGGTLALRAQFGVLRFMDIQVGGMYVGLAPGASNADHSSMWATSAGVRFKRPWDAKRFRGLQPWVDGNLSYVRLDGRDRFGFDIGLGVQIPIGKRRKFSVGPFVRYFQVVETDPKRQLPVTGGTSEEDPKIFIAGLSFEARLIDRRSWRHTQPDRDRDGDGVLDRDDRCPDVPGTIDNQGCPVYQRMHVGESELELTENLRFAVDRSTIEPESMPILDEIVALMKANRAFHLRVLGHADSTGSDEHNQQLGVARAVEVIEYLAQHGVARERMAPRSHGESRPVESNQSVDGRSANRRVEFFIVRPEVD